MINKTISGREIDIPDLHLNNRITNNLKKMWTFLIEEAKKEYSEPDEKWKKITPLSIDRDYKMCLLNGMNPNNLSPSDMDTICDLLFLNGEIKYRMISK